MDKKQIIKMALLHAAKAAALPLFIAVVAIVVVSSLVRALHFSNSTEMEKNYRNYPHVSREYEKGIKYMPDGTAKAEKTAIEILDLMDKKTADIPRTLKPEEFKKFINTENVCNTLDTRKNPDKKIDWESGKIVDPSNKEIQGIVKYKRALEDGSVERMTYVTPEKLQKYIDEYKANPNKATRKKALTHYTIELENLTVEGNGGNYTIGTDGTARLINAGDSIDVPQGNGYGTTYTYNSWQLIGAGKQLELRNQAGMTFDEEGFGRINGRYTVAVTPKFGKVGDYIDYYYIDNSGNEQVIPCIICDVKGSDAQNAWGHHGGENMLEFYVNEETWCTPGWVSGVHSWYNDCGGASSMHVNPGTSGFHEEWSGHATKVVNGGSYFDNPDFVDGKIEETNNVNGSNDKEVKDNEEAKNNEEQGSAYEEIKGNKEPFYCVKVAKWKEVRTIVEEIPPDTVVSDTKVAYMDTININYKEFVKQIAMQNELLNTYHNISEDDDFTLDILKLAYDGFVECTIFDNIARTKSVSEVQKQREIPPENPDDDPIIETYIERTTVITDEDFVGTNLTDAKVWFLNYNVEYDYHSIGDDLGYYTLHDPIAELKLEDKEKEEDFFKKIEKYPIAKSSLITGREMLFDIMKNNKLIKNYYPISKYISAVIREKKPDEVNLFYYYPPIIKWEKGGAGFEFFTIWPERYDDVEYKKVQLIKENED